MVNYGETFNDLYAALMSRFFLYIYNNNNNNKQQHHFSTKTNDVGTNN